VKRLNKLRSLDARVLSEVCLVRSTLHSVRPVVPKEFGDTIDRDVRALDQLIPKLRERKRV
jgi:hypothetical protein